MEESYNQSDEIFGHSTRARGRLTTATARTSATRTTPACLVQRHHPDCWYERGCRGLDDVAPCLGPAASTPGTGHDHPYGGIP